MRKPFNFRLSDGGHQWLAEVAAKHDVTSADVLRACMTVAVKHSREVDAVLKEQM